MYTKKLYVSGGNFHELQEVYSDLKGVVNTVTGYINPASETVSFEQAVSGEVAAVMGLEIEYNPKWMDLSTLMDILFSVTNPYSENRQGSLEGAMYRCGVYYVSAEDIPQIQLHLNFIANRGNPPAVEGSELTVNDPVSDRRRCRKLHVVAEKLVSFVTAEDEHQNFLKKNPDTKTDIDFQLLKKYMGN